MLYLKPIQTVLLFSVYIYSAWGSSNLTDLYICEKKMEVISCPETHRINIDKANYGRERQDQCNKERKALPRDCISRNAVLRLPKICNGKKVCRLKATNKLFGDPCPGTPKYLWVRWSCLPTKPWRMKDLRTEIITVRQGKTATLTCEIDFNEEQRNPRQKILIRWLNLDIGNPIYDSSKPYITVNYAEGSHEIFHKKNGKMAGMRTTLIVKAERPSTVTYECSFRLDPPSPKRFMTQHVMKVIVLEPTTTTPKPTSKPATSTSQRCVAARKEGVNLCAKHAKCFDIGNSFRCQCAEGYVGNGLTRNVCKKLQKSPRLGLHCQRTRERTDGCISRKLVDMKDQLPEMGIDAQMRELKAISINRSLSGDELIYLTGIMKSMVTTFDEPSDRSYTSVMNKPKVVSTSMVKATSTLLSKKEIWKDIDSSSTRRSLAMNLTKTLESTCMATTREAKNKMVIDETLVDVEVDLINQNTRSIEFRPGGNDEVHVSLNTPSRHSYVAPSGKNGNKRVVFVRYKGLQTYLNDGKEDTARKSNTTEPKMLVFSDVISATTSESGLVKKIRFRLSHSRSDEPINETLGVKRCAYWDVINSTWAFDGCRILNSSGRDATVCECDHLTSFAIILDFRDSVKELPPNHQLSLSIITYVGCILSIFCCIFGVWTYDILRRSKGDRMNSEGRTSFFIYEMICLSLLVAQTIFLVGIYHIQIKIVCTIIAALLHYFFLLLFEWMLMAGVYYILVYTQPYSIVHLDSHRRWFIVVLLLIPATIVGISLGLRPREYGTKTHCWLSVENGLIWAFVGPATGMLAVNMVLLSVLIVLTWKIKPSDMLETGEVNKSWVTSRARKLRYELLFCIVLGATWIFGYLLIENTTSLVFSYIFTILNSLQGVFILISYANWNRIRAAYIAEFRRKRWLPESFRRWLHSRQHSPGGPPGVGMMGSSASAAASQRARNSRGSNSQRGLLIATPTAHASDSAGALSHTTRSTRLGSGSSGAAKWSVSAGAHGVLDGNENSIGMVTETDAGYNENYIGHSMVDEPRQVFADDRMISEFASQSDAELLHMTAAMPLREHEEGGDHRRGLRDDVYSQSSSSSSPVTTAASTTSPTSSYSDEAGRTGAVVMDELPTDPPKLPVVCSVPSPFALHHSQMPNGSGAVTAPRMARRPGNNDMGESDYLTPTNRHPQRHTLDSRGRARGDLELRASIGAKQKRFSQTDLYANADADVYYSEPPLEPSTLERRLASASRVTDV